MNEKARHILEQVRKLYYRYGIKSVTMDDVARHLCISKKTLYEYFTDKEDLVEKVMLLQFDEKDVHFKKIAEMNLNAVEELLQVYRLLNEVYRDYNPSIEYDIRKYYPDLYSKIREIRRKRMYESTLRNLERGKEQGLYRPEIDSVILSKLHVFRIENLQDYDLFSIEEITTFRVFHEIFVYHIHGLLSDKGRKYFRENFEKIKSDLL